MISHKVKSQSTPITLSSDMLPRNMDPEANILASPEDAPDLVVLQRRIESQAEAVKRAIRDYKAILRDSAAGAVRKTQTRLEVEEAVKLYIQLNRKLEELLRQREVGALSPTAF